jgi:hypothetical protein
MSNLCWPHSFWFYGEVVCYDGGDAEQNHSTHDWQTNKQKEMEKNGFP